MKKKYIVALSEAERQDLEMSLSKGLYRGRRQARALVLLGANVGLGGKCMKDAAIALAYGLTTQSVERIRKRFCELGLSGVLAGKSRACPPRKLVYDSVVESHLIALRCSEPPLGYSQWSLRLLADKMVALDYVEAISHESVRHILKKTNYVLGE